MNERAHKDLDALRRARDAWVGFTVLASLLVCGSVVLLYVLQVAALQRAVDMARDLRQARIDLHQGFMHAMLGAEPDSPWDRARGPVLMAQGIREFRSVLPSVPHSTASETMDQELRRFEELLQRGASGSRALIELRVSFYQLDRLASGVEAQAAHELHLLQVRQAVTFWILLAGSGFLLAVVIAGAVRAALREHAALHGQQEAEMQFAHLADNIEDVFWVRDPGTGRVLFVNAAYGTVWGRSPETLLRNHHAWLEAVAPEDRARMSRIRRRDDASFDEEYRIVRPDGEVRWVHERAFVARNGQGKALRMFGIAEDITVRKQAEAELVASERRLRWIIDLVPHAIYAKDPEGRYLLANKATAEWLGCGRPVDLLGRRPDEFGMDPRDAEEDRRIDRQVLATQQPFDAAVETRTIGGAQFALMIRKTPFQFRGATTDSVLGVSSDVTPLKKAQEDLQQSLVLFEATLQATDNGVMAAGPDGTVLLWNQRLVDLIGSAAPLQQRCEAALLAAIGVAMPDAGRDDLPVVRTGTGGWLEMRGQPMVIRGRPAGRVWTFRDVTAREQARVDSEKRERELEDRVEVRTRELAEANHDLEAFTGAVSHDLRAPLAAIRAFTEAILRKHADRLEPQGRHYLDRVLAASENMQAMIEGLLELARHSRAPVHRKTLDLSRMAREAHALLAHSYAGHHVQFVVAHGLRASGDPALIATLLQNLIGNALKYSRQRSPARIDVGAASDANGLHFFVRDNGAGFDPEYADRLFKPFSRLHSSDEFEGHGIGLATTHRIIARHGGRIWAEGALDQGATFRFTLE